MPVEFDFTRRRKAAFGYKSFGQSAHSRQALKTGGIAAVILDLLDEAAIPPQELELLYNLFTWSGPQFPLALGIHAEQCRNVTNYSPNCYLIVDIAMLAY